jgi:hypothetical protein
MDFDLLIFFDLADNLLCDYLIKMLREVSDESFKKDDDDELYRVWCKYFNFSIVMNWGNANLARDEFNINTNKWVMIETSIKNSDYAFSILFRLVSHIINTTDADIAFLENGAVPVIKRKDGKITVNPLEESYDFPFEELKCEYEIETSEEL